MKPRFKESDVLSYKTSHSRPTVRRYYSRWRKRNRIPERCDIPSCVYHTNPLKWNEKPLPVILDHVNGNRKDNTTNNLRYLCPNCDAQQSTRGGKNKGRIQNETEMGYQVEHRNGQIDAIIHPKTFALKLNINESKITTDEQKPNN